MNRHSMGQLFCRIKTQINDQNRRKTYVESEISTSPGTSIHLVRLSLYRRGYYGINHRVVEGLPHILWDWLLLLRQKKLDRHEPESIVFQMPKQHEHAKILALVCRGSPKLRALLRMVAELVIVGQEKLILWCGIPANQVLVLGVMQILNLDAACYTAELNREQRGIHVKKFTQERGCVVFIGGFAVGSYGLNLHHQCHHHAFFDAPPGVGARAQARGRDRRMGQQYDVEEFDIYVKGTFQYRMIANNIEKAVPGALAEYSFNIEQGENQFLRPDDNVQLELPQNWFLINGELVSEDDPRTANLSQEDVLSPEQFIAALLDEQAGQQLEAKDWEVETHRCNPNHPNPSTFPEQRLASCRSLHQSSHSPFSLPVLASGHMRLEIALGLRYTSSFRPMVTGIQCQVTPEYLRLRKPPQ